MALRDRFLMSYIGRYAGIFRGFRQGLLFSLDGSPFRARP
jgi:hypothetical protein